MKVGTTVPQRSTGRMGIRSSNNYYGGVHCGETFDVKLNRKWIPPRIEMGNNWYLVAVDVGVDNLVGLIVRI